MKYNIGDAVWIRSDLEKGVTYGGNCYTIKSHEKDIRGLSVIITKISGYGREYHCKEYSFFTLDMINHEKSELKISEPKYEIY